MIRAAVAVVVFVIVAARRELVSRFGDDLRQIVVEVLAQLIQFLVILLFQLDASVVHGGMEFDALGRRFEGDRKSTRLNSSHSQISYAVFCSKQKGARS